MDKHSNNFDAIRLMAASLVLFGHHYPLVGDGRVEPSFLGLNTLGGLAVSIFFTLSGYLVTQSWFADPHLLRFAVRRILRIWPALTVVVLLCALVLGPALSPLVWSSYVIHEQTLQYFSTLWMQPAYYLPGVFTANATPAVNGSIWTIPLEVQCYMALMVCGAVGVLQTRGNLMRFALLYIGWYVIWQRPELYGRIQYPLEFGAYFVAGAFLYAARDAWRAHALLWCTGVAVLATFAWYINLRYFAMLIGVSWLTIFIGQMSTPILRRAGRFGDFSYGIYLFAFPVQQTVILFFYPAMGFYGSMLLALGITVACAALSWYWVEKPALAFKPRKAFVNAEESVSGLLWWSKLKTQVLEDVLRFVGWFGAFTAFAIPRLLAIVVMMLAVWAVRDSEKSPPLTFFSPDAYSAELARRTELGMVGVDSVEGLRRDLQMAREHGARLQIVQRDIAATTPCRKAQ